MTQTLLNEFELIEFMPIEFNTPPCSFRELFNIEMELARTRIGYDFWLVLIAQKADYSSKPDWASGGSYTTGDVVKHKKRYYQATTATTAQPPLKPDWDLAPKFKAGSCQETYNTIYCNFLGPYIAAKVLRDRMPFIRNSVGSRGVVVYDGIDYKPTNKEDYSLLKTAISRDIAKVWNNFRYYMRQDAQKENNCLEDYLGYDEDNCTPGGGRTGFSEQTGVYRVE